MEKSRISPSSDLTHISLFSGIGGDTLAAGRAGFRTVALCENDEYCRYILGRNWPDIPIWGDIKNVTEKEFQAVRRVTGGRPVTAISGGYPCQGESVAGQRGGEADDRWLWPEMFRIILALRPSWVIGENVAGHVSLGLPGVQADLESAGFEIGTLVIPACAVGALHRRDRVFIVAHSSRQQLEESVDAGGAHGRRSYREPARSGEVVADPDGDGQPQPPGGFTEGRNGTRDSRTMADTDGLGAEWCKSGDGPGSGSQQDCQDVADASLRRVERDGPEGESEPEKPLEEALLGRDGSGGFAGGSWWEVEPDVGRVVNGLSTRVDRYIHKRRIEALGNAIVPQQIYPIFRTIALIEEAEIGY